MPATASLSICERRMPATRERWSAASQSAVAQREEVADLAVRARPRLGDRRVGDEPLEPAAESPVVRAELLGAERHALAGAEHDVHEPRGAALDPRDLLRVEAELEDVRGLRVPRELRVDDLVGAVRLELEEVGAPRPAGGVVEDGLVDHVDGSPRGSGARRRRRRPARRRACRWRAARRGTPPRAPRPSAGSGRPAGSRPAAAPARRARLELQRDEMLAVEEVVQQRRRKIRRIWNRSHLPTLSSSQASPLRPAQRIR